MLKNFFFVLFAIISLIAILNCFGIVNWLDSSKPTNRSLGISNSNDVSAACDDSHRYNGREEQPGGGKQVTMDTFNHYVDNFQATCSDVDSTECVFFSKRAFDKIFIDDTTANGIVCSFGRSNNGHLQIVIVGGKSENTLLDTISDPPIVFLSQTYCPPNCKVKPL
ncbi:MAG: hypothetical protein LH473_09840 [Chitinophagales bacterium]|nr:hypothetical protein [Chitinophagales bacterium]